MKITDDVHKIILPKGYPLSAFANVEPFASWLQKMFVKKTAVKSSRTVPAKKTSPVQQPPAPSPASKLPDWLDHIYLEELKSNRIAKGPHKGYFEYTADFSTRRKVAIAVSQPKDTLILFGTDKKENETPDYCRIRFILEPKYGTLSRVEISGNLRFQMSRNLVKPVVEHNGKWVDHSLKHVEVPLEDAVLQLGAGLPPRLTEKLSVPDIAVQIAGSTLVARLSEVELAGTAANPKIRFVKTRLVYLNN